MKIKHLLFFTASMPLFFCACQKTSVIKENIETDEQYHLKFKELNGKISYLFENNEPEEVSYNPQLRSFSTLEPLQLSLKDDSLKIKFYSPRTIKEVTILAKSVGYPQQFKLATIDSIPPFADFSIHLPKLNEEKVFESVDGKKVSFPGLRAGDVSLTAESNDEYFLKLKQIKINWICSFSAYSRQGDWERRILPPHMKEAVAIALNMTYMFGSKDYRDSLLGPWMGRFYGNGGKTDIIDNAKLLANIMSSRNILFGHVIGVGGLGGGGTYGLAQYQYLEHYADDKSHQETMIHEFGHNLGYNHTSGMTYGNWWPYGARMYERMSVSKELPVYSRKFLRTRANTTIYGYNPNNVNYPSKFDISRTNTSPSTYLICTP